MEISKRCRTSFGRFDGIFSHMWGDVSMGQFHGSRKIGTWHLQHDDGSGQLTWTLKFEPATPYIYNIYNIYICMYMYIYTYLIICTFQPDLSSPSPFTTDHRLDHWHLASAGFPDAVDAKVQPPVGVRDHLHHGHVLLVLKTWIHWIQQTFHQENWG